MKNNRSTPAGLTDSEIEKFKEDGFLVIDNVFSPEDVQSLIQATQDPAIVEEIQKRDFENTTIHLLSLAARHPAFLKLARDPRIINRLKSIIGPDIQLQHSKLTTKPHTKGKGPFAWHQDFAYFPHTNTDLVAAMVMLDDATPENGCMQVVKGNHNLGLRNHMKDGIFMGGCQESELWADPDKIALITPRAGGISLHHCLSLHGSEANQSGRPRRGIVFQYRADDAYQLADNIWEDTGLLMCGQYKEQVRCEPGIFQLPKRHREPPFGNVWHQKGELARRRDYFG
jgi:phytanoyl-CoA hydroxylase